MFKKSIVFLLVFSAFVGSIGAQVRPGLKMGYNLSGVIAEDNIGRNKDQSGNPDNFNLKSGFQLGLVADCPLGDSWAIQPGVRFAMIGFNDKYKANLEELRKFNLFYLQIPVYAQYKLNIAEETNLLFQAGPYAGFGLFGRQVRYRNGSSQELSDNDKKINFGNNPSDRQNASDDLVRLDYGVGAGVGIEFFRFQFLFNYDVGLNDMLFAKRPQNAHYNVNMRNQCFSVTLAVIFGRRDPLQRMRDF